MSIILGKINLNDHPIHPDQIIDRMLMPLAKYKTDKTELLSTESLFFACAHQYITTESYHEILPYYDSERNIYFTADCMIDNRAELIRELQVNENTTDSQLVYQSYLKWGERNVCEHLLGCFSFAIYDANKKRFLLYTDHTSTRCVYYVLNDSNVGFSTLIYPLVYGFPGMNFPINKKWQVACESSFSPNVILFPGITPLEHIYHLPNGHYLWVENGQHGLVQYWNPKENINPLTGYRRDEYKQMVLDMMDACIRPLLRSCLPNNDANFSIQLSSGLDSASVAGFTASILAEQSKSLYSYTAVPLATYTGKANDYDCINESEGVKCICKKYPNIIPTFLDCAGFSLLTENERISDYLEQPIKATSNLYWMDQLYATISKTHSKIVLNGENGNSTISYGNYLSLPYQDWKDGHPRKALHELKIYATANKRSYPVIAKIICSELYRMHFPSTKILNTSMLKDCFLEQYHIRDVLRTHLKHNGGNLMDSRQEMIGNMTNNLYFQHTGIHSTKMGLANGIIIRDPLRNRKLIELCLSLPIECFFDSGLGRMLVRNFFWDIVPTEIIQGRFGRGIQSADFLYRVSLQWDEHKDSFFDTIHHPILSEYVDPKKTGKLEDNINKGYENWDMITMMQALSLHSFSHYLQTNEKICRDAKNLKE